MRVVALISGGKDSCFNMMQCIAAGHEVVALANLAPHSGTEIDSYMYQSVGHEAIGLMAAAMGLPLFRATTLGRASQRGRVYRPDATDEVEDLHRLLARIGREMAVEAVSVGAILSDYQRVRVENVCVRLGLVPLAYLWQQDQKELLNEMIKCEIDAVVIKVAALGLDPNKHLGRTLSSLQPHLHSMNDKYGLNVCGEGGEYETLTLDCPLFKSRIIIVESEIIYHTNDTIAQVGFLKLNKLQLETKLPILDQKARFDCLPLKNSDGYVTDYGEEASELNTVEELEEIENTDFEICGSSVEQGSTSVKSADGWLWIGGLQGTMGEVTDNLRSILEKNEQTVQDVCFVTMFISNMSEYSHINQIYCETFNHPNPPSRACVEVPSTIPIILSALSWSPPLNQSGDAPIERQTMHVQSRSHWAPANIGPYSQAVRIGELIHLAGQLGLVPGSLAMVGGGVRAQCQLALRHIGRLLRAVDPNVNLRDVVQGVCYVTSLKYVECARMQWEAKTNNAIVDYVVVSRLPKEALIEWTVWAHRHNNQFEYEETGKCIDNYSISIYRRWNYENNIAAIVCHVENVDSVELTRTIFAETIEYTIKKLQQGHENYETSVYNLQIFLPVAKIEKNNEFLSFMEAKTNELALVFTFIPVAYVKNEHTYLSICGVRNQ